MMHTPDVHGYVLSYPRRASRARVAMVLLAIGVGVALVLMLAVLLTQEDIARDVERAVRGFVTIPRAMVVLALLCAVAATAIAYGCSIERSVDDAGQSRRLYSGMSGERANASESQSPSSRAAGAVES